jgi:N-acetylmuramoyl-L-alanine amidase
MPETNSKSLIKPVIALCPGHGGRDPGAVNGLVTEAQITYQWTLDLQRILSIGFMLESHNLFVWDESEAMKENDAKFMLSERIGRTKDVKANILLSVHVNSFSNPKAHGSEVWIHAADEKNDLDLATKLATALSDRDMSNRGVKYTGNEDDGEHGLYVLRKTLDIPSVLLELGFLSNNVDRSYLILPGTRNAQMARVATALAYWVQDNYDYLIPAWVPLLWGAYIPQEYQEGLK